MEQKSNIQHPPYYKDTTATKLYFHSLSCFRHPHFSFAQQDHRYIPSQALT